MDEATTVMEIRLQSIETGTPIAVATLDGIFDVVAVASVRVVRRADGHVVSESVATDGAPNLEDGGRQFLVWADHDAELLRHRLDEAMIGLAESLAEAVFVGPPPPPPPPPLPRRCSHPTRSTGCSPGRRDWRGGWIPRPGPFRPLQGCPRSIVWILFPKLVIAWQ
jgi:hypothetical protein